MKKLIPYLISYLIIVAGMIAFGHFSHHQGARSFIALNTTLPHAELIAKLQQVGIPESAVHDASVRPAPLATAIYDLVFYGTIFGVFLGLACLIKRALSKS